MWSNLIFQASIIVGGLTSIFLLIVALIALGIYWYWDKHYNYK